MLLCGALPNHRVRSRTSNLAETKVPTYSVHEDVPEQKQVLGVSLSQQHFNSTQRAWGCAPSFSATCALTFPTLLSRTVELEHPGAAAMRMDYEQNPRAGLHVSLAACKPHQTRCCSVVFSSAITSHSISQSQGEPRSSQPQLAEENVPAQKTFSDFPRYNC